MSRMDDYFETVTPSQKAEFERVRALVRETVPTVTEGESYGMPAYLYRGKAFLSAMALKNHLSIYPFSGKVIVALAEKLDGYEISAGSGSIHYSEDKPLPEALLKDIIACRLKEIDERLDR